MFLRACSLRVEYRLRHQSCTDVGRYCVRSRSEHVLSLGKETHQHVVGDVVRVIPIGSTVAFTPYVSEKVPERAVESRGVMSLQRFFVSCLLEAIPQPQSAVAEGPLVPDSVNRSKESHFC